MVITSIQINRLENVTNKMRGTASVTLDDMIVIHDIKILESPTGKFLAMPSKQLKSGIFRDIVHPINHQGRECFEKLIFAAYEEAIRQNTLRLAMVINREDQRAYTLAEQEPSQFHYLNMEGINCSPAEYESGLPRKKTGSEVKLIRALQNSLWKWVEG